VVTTFENVGLSVHVGVILLGFVLALLFVYSWHRVNQRRAAQNLSQLTVRDLFAFLPWLIRRLYLALPSALEVGVLISLSIAYAHPLVDFSDDLVLPGETEVLTGMVMPIVEAFYEGTEFPLWNPYFQHGKSLIADPFLFFFNPFISLPMILFGVNNGAKIAAVMAFALAAVGMWVLMKLLGTRGPVRLWCGATYMLAGGMPAHLWAGHFQLAIGLAWVPWCFAGILYALENRTRRSVVIAAIPLALLFFTGNLYVPFYVLMGLLILFIAYVVCQQYSPVLVHQARGFFLAGLFALGLIAVQLFPEWAARSYIYKGSERDFVGSQTVNHLLTNYLISDPEYYRQANLGDLPQVQEYYNYVGVLPFVLLVFVVPAAQRRKHIVLAFAIYFVLMLAWGAVKFSPVRFIFSAFPFLYQFRFPARALRIGTFALISLAGLGLDEIWLYCRAFSPWPADPLPDRTVRMLLAVGVLAFVIASAVHLYQTNRTLLGLAPRCQQVDEAFKRLAIYDSSEYTVANYVVSNAGMYACYRYHLRWHNVILGWTVARVSEGLAPGSILARPKYVIVPTGVSVPVETDSPPQLVQTTYDLETWRISDALPFAFTVPYFRMQEWQTPLSTATEVIEQRASRPTANEIKVVVTGAEDGDLLVVLEFWFPGWRVSVDGQPGRLLKVGHFLVVPLLPGDHIVTLRYDPPAFKIGLTISIGTVCALMMYILHADTWFLRRVLKHRPPGGGEGF
jgi:hypothetical protein